MARLRKEANAQIAQVVTERGWGVLEGQSGKLILPDDIRKDLQAKAEEAKALGSPLSIEKIQELLADFQKAKKSRHPDWTIIPEDDEEEADWRADEVSIGRAAIKQHWRDVDEQERVCIWCGEVQESLEALEAHEAECQ